jgi:hypothetical protein
LLCRCATSKRMVLPKRRSLKSDFRSNRSRRVAIFPGGEREESRWVQCAIC